MAQINVKMITETSIDFRFSFRNTFSSCPEEINTNLIITITWIDFWSPMSRESGSAKHSLKNISLASLPKAMYDKNVPEGGDKPKHFWLPMWHITGRLCGSRIELQRIVVHAELSFVTRFPSSGRLSPSRMITHWYVQHLTKSQLPDYKCAQLRVITSEKHLKQIVT